MFDDFLEALKSDNFEERPVDAKTFVEGEDYLNQPPLSQVQYDIVEAMSQIYKLEDVIELLGDTEGRRYYKKYTKNEVILQLGKGSGKDFTSTVACAYIVYKLLCLKDPARYFGKPAGDAIDIINVAINAQQAKNVFFKGFKNKIESIIQKPNLLSLTSLSLFIRDTPKESHTRVSTLFLRYLTRSLDSLQRLELEMIRVRQQTISIKPSVLPLIHDSQT
jgi:hypothetical protein